MKEKKAMKNHIKIGVTFILLSTLWGCTANTKSYALSGAEGVAISARTERLEQKDRDTRHVERMRKADAYARATRDVKGGVTYSPNTTTIVVPR